MSERSDSPSDLPPEKRRALVEAMAHPVRAKLLIAVADQSSDGVSIRQISERIREPPRRVRYHLDVLLGLGLIGIASRRRRRGVLERFYRAEITPALSSEELDSYDEDQAHQISVQVLKAVLGDASLALTGRTFGRRAGHMVLRMPGEVDEQGWRELGSLQENIMRDAQGVIHHARERLQTTGDKPIPALVALLLFETPPWPAP